MTNYRRPTGGPRVGLAGAARAGLRAARDAAKTHGTATSAGQAAVPAAATAGIEVDYERIEQIVRSVAEELWARRLDLPATLREIALRESAHFVLENIPLHLAKGHYDLRRDAVLAAPDGLFMEFGVWQGAWLRAMAPLRDVPFYGFDSFEGLPEPFSLDHARGHFDLGGELPQVPDNVTLVKGWFADTLPRFLADHQTEPVAFVHVDCDLYSSTKTVLDLLAPRFVAGTQLVLDDFMYHPGWQDQEHRAFFEFLDDHGWAFEYTGYASEWPACSAAVRLVSRT